jgi:hypothetical protein
MKQPERQVIPILPGSVSDKKNSRLGVKPGGYFLKSPRLA